MKRKHICESFYMKFKDRQTWQMRIEVTTVFTWGNEEQVQTGGVYEVLAMFHILMWVADTQVYPHGKFFKHYWRCTCFMYFTVCVLLLLVKKIFPASCLFVCLCFSGPHPQHMEIPRLGIKSELQLPAYTTATATQDLSNVCDLYHSSWHCWILKPLSEARDWTSVLMDTSQIHHYWAMTGTPQLVVYITTDCTMI